MLSKHARPLLLVTAASLLAAFALAMVFRMDDSRGVLLPDAVVAVLPEPKTLQPFALLDQHEQSFDLARLRGKWTFVFFGFTYCPDICPTTLAVLAQARRAMLQEGTGDGVQVVLVSVDPHRDTPDKLAQYVGYFDPEFIGARGEEAQIANLAAQLGAAFQVEYTPGVDDYPVYHSSAVFLVDPLARLHAIFKAPLDALAIGKRFADVRRFASSEAR